MKSKKRSYFSKVTSLLTSGAVIAGCLPTLEVAASASGSAASVVTLTRYDVSRGDGWYWDGDSLLIYGASFSVPENSAYFGEFSGFGAGDTIEVEIEGSNEITLGNGAVFVDSADLPLNVDGSGWVDVSGNGALLSGSSVSYYGGLIDAAGEASIFDSQSVEIRSSYMTAEYGGIISGGGSLKLTSAQITAKTIGAADITAVKSLIELPEGFSETASLRLDSSVAVIAGTEFSGMELNASQSVALFPDLDISASSNVNYTGDGSANATPDSRTVFCNEFITDDNHILTAGTHSGMYYNGSKAVMAKNGAVVTGGNYFTTPNKSTFVAGSMWNSSPDATIQNAALVGLSTGSSIYEYDRDYIEGEVVMKGTLSAAKITITNSSFFGNAGNNDYGIYISSTYTSSDSPNTYISPNSVYEYSTEDDIPADVIVSRKEGCTFSDVFPENSRITAETVNLKYKNSRNRNAYIDGKITEHSDDNAVYGKMNGTFCIREGSFSARHDIDKTFGEYRCLYIAAEKSGRRIIHTAPDGSDKFSDYIQLSSDGKNKVYIGTAVLEPSLYIADRSSKTIDRSTSVEYEYSIYNCDSPLIEWLNSDGTVMDHSPNGITAEFVTPGPDEALTNRKLRITADENAPSGAVRFRIRCGELVSNTIEANIAGFSFMMDFRASSFRSNWKYGADFTDPSQNYAGAGWRWYGSDTTENGVSYKAKTLVLEDGFSFATSSNIGIALPDGSTLITEGYCTVSSYVKPIKSEGSLTVQSASSGKRGTLSLLNSLDGTKTEAASNGSDPFTGELISGSIETVKDLTINGCDIDISKEFKGFINILYAGGDMDLCNTTISTSDGIYYQHSTAAEAKGRLLIKPGVKFDTLPAALKFGSLKTVQMSELSELTDQSSTVYTAESFASMPAGSAQYELSTAGAPLKLVTKPLTVDKPIEICKDAYGNQSDTISLEALNAVTGGSGSYNFSSVGDLPSGLELSGNTLLYDFPNKDMALTSVKFTVTDADPELSIPGESVELTLNIGPIFKAFFITYTEPEHGTIAVGPSASGKADLIGTINGRNIYKMPAEPGQDVTITLRPDRGYDIANFLIDDSSIFQESNNAIAPDGTITLSSIDNDHTVSVIYGNTGNPDFEKFCTISLDSSLENEADKFSVEYSFNGRTVSKPLTEPVTVMNSQNIRLIAKTGTDFCVESASLGGADIEMQFDSDNKLFCCDFTAEKSAVFSAKLNELCRVSVNVDPAKAQSAVSDSVKRFGDYTPKGSVFSFSVTQLNKYTIAEVRSSADPSVKLTPVRIENGAFFYEWTVTGNADWEVICNEPITLMTSCTGPGTVTPGSGTFAKGENVTLTVTPDPGCYVKSAKLNGTAVSLTNGKYTFTVTGDCIFEAVFEKNSGGSSGGHSGGSGSSGGTSDRTSYPTINGVEKSWKDIAADLGKLPSGSSVIIHLNGETVVPVEVIKAIAGSKIKAEFVVDSARSWLVDGAKISVISAAGLSLMPGNADKSSLRGLLGSDVRTNTIGIPADFKLTFRKAFAGQFANVYKLVDKKLVYVCCTKIASDGSAVIPGADSSAEYIVMVCEFSDEPGDVNNDGTLNALDAAALLKHIVGISEGTNMLFADFNHDGSVNALDSSAILKSIVSR